MIIEFVNHASYILNHNDVSLLVDPWIEGSVFDNGWSHIEPTKFSYNDFSKITHIWFSHEHPDHFYPPNLKCIPEKIRSSITVLYQKSIDGKVAEFCKKLNFKNVIELDEKWFEITKDFHVLNIGHTDGDSWLCAKIKEKTILNINDCVLENKLQAKTIKKLINTNIDVLLTQFSYANWVGNKEDTKQRKEFAQKKIDQIKYQVEVFKPKYTIPFASFVWFSHEENFYMNDAINKIDYVNTYIQENLPTEPIILFVADKWEIGTYNDNKVAVDKWMQSYHQNIQLSKATKTKTVSKEDLKNNGNEFIKNLKRNNTFWMRLFLKPTYIYVYDYNSLFKLDLKSGFNEAGKEEDKCDVTMSSEALNYCFKFLWGGSTTRINGRFQVNNNGSFYNWKLYFQTSQLNNLGEKFDFFFVLNTLKRKVLRSFN